MFLANWPRKSWSLYYLTIQESLQIEMVLPDNGFSEQSETICLWLCIQRKITDEQVVIRVPGSWCCDLTISLHFLCKAFQSVREQGSLHPGCMLKSQPEKYGCEINYLWLDFRNERRQLINMLSNKWKRGYLTALTAQGYFTLSKNPLFCRHCLLSLIETLNYKVGWVKAGYGLSHIRSPAGKFLGSFLQSLGGGSIVHPWFLHIFLSSSQEDEYFYLEFSLWIQQGQVSIIAIH